MDQRRVSEILEKIKTSKIAVYGDYCLDAYWIMDPRGSEVSIETGKKAEAVASHYYSPGRSSQYCRQSFCPKIAAGIKAIAVVGDDIYEQELSAQLNALKADTTGLVIQKKISTPTPI